ncbi:SPOSA6832_05100, partial [Sporobolomyces salmonicolor]
MSHPYANWDRGYNDDDDDNEVAEEHRYSKSAVLFCIEATDSMLAPTLETSPSTPLDPSAPTPSSTPAQTTREAINSLGWKGQDPKSKMELVLRTAYAMMKRKVISSPKDLVGILIWNTVRSDSLSFLPTSDLTILLNPQETAQGPADATFQHSHVLLDLKQVDAEGIRKLKDLLQEAENDENFLRDLFKPNRGQNIVPETFGNCNSIFRAKHVFFLLSLSPNSSNRVFWVTDNDDPCGGSLQLRKIALNKRKDLYDMDFGIETFFIPKTADSGFDLDLFYGGIVTMDEDEDAGIEWPQVHDDLHKTLGNMIESMRLKDTAKRVAFRIPFVLARELSIGISGYNMVGEETRKLPIKVDLNNAAGDEVISKTFYQDGETGIELNPKTEIKKYFQVGKSDPAKGVQAAKIFFTEEDVRKVKTIGRPPSLKLLGFMPREGNLKFWETVKHSYFIYPDEERYEGSIRTFASLLKSMLKKDVIGYASLIARTISRPQVVILLPQVCLQRSPAPRSAQTSATATSLLTIPKSPQAEELNKNGVQVRPPGIHICQLPFADDIRGLGFTRTTTVLNAPDPDADDDEEPAQPAVDLAMKIIARLTKKYKPDVYPNPALNYFYETLAALALEEDPPEPEDKTVPLYDTIDQRVGSMIAQLKSLIPEDEGPPLSTTSKHKRLLKGDPDAPMPDLSAFVAFLRDKGDTMKVAELKAGLKAMGERVTGNKAELRERALGYLQAHGLWAEEIEDEGKKKKKKKKKKSAIEKEEEMDVEDDEEGRDEPFASDVDLKPKTKRRRKVVPSYDESG